LVLITAALCHDADHPGLNNVFHAKAHTRVGEYTEDARSKARRGTDRESKRGGKGRERRERERTGKERMRSKRKERRKVGFSRQFQEFFTKPPL
jgi:hypothetical protein